MRLFKLALLVVIGVSGCKEKPVELPDIELSGNEVLISNEGNFGWGEGSLSVYNPETKQVQNDVYQRRNGESIGNIFQSIAYFNNQYFFVVNNSNKIIVTNDSFQKVNIISGLISPRYFYPVSNSKAYVTDLYNKGISVIDLNSMTVDNKIEINGWTETGVVSDSIFWVTNVESSYIYQINTNIDEIIDSVKVGYAPESIVMVDSLLWVLSKGDETNGVKGSLSAINIRQQKVVYSKELDGVPTKLEYHKESNTLFFINKDIYSINAQLGAEPNVWLAANDLVFYGIGIDEERNEIYFSHIYDFVQKSTVYRYDLTKVLLDEFNTGIISGDFFFQ